MYLFSININIHTNAYNDIYINISDWFFKKTVFTVFKIMYFYRFGLLGADGLQFTKQSRGGLNNTAINIIICVIR